MAQLALKWTGEESQLFVGRDSYGHIVVSGSWPKDDDPTWTEWKGVKPSDLLVLALLSCSSYDVVTILRRQRQELTGLFVTAEAEQASEPPYQFTHIHLHYVAAGPGLDSKKVERAIVLSEEKYCSVAATIRGVTKITHSYAVTTAPGSAATDGGEQ
jgi:putative redox protein